MNATKRATRILLKEVNQNFMFYFCKKTAFFSLRAEQTDATQACYRRA